MSKKDYIPQSVSGFNDWQKQAVAKLTENKTTWGLPEDRLTAITAKATEWDTFYPRYADKNHRSSVVVEEKNVKIRLNNSRRILTARNRRHLRSMAMQGEYRLSLH